MFALKDRKTGEWIHSYRTGARMTWSERRLAKMAARWISRDRSVQVDVVNA